MNFKVTWYLFEVDEVLLAATRKRMIASNLTPSIFYQGLKENEVMHKPGFPFSVKERLHQSVCMKET